MPLSQAVEPRPQTIAEAQNSIKTALLELAPSTSDTVRPFLCPPGYELVVELREEGRPTRKNASSENWSPETGEIFLYFEKRREAERGLPQAPAIQPESKATKDAESPVRQLASALQEVEPTRDFVSLKWFRDDVLPARGFSWAQDPNERQAVMREAIEAGLVLTSRVHNPHAPQYPTTTIRANRVKLTGLSGSTPARYHPVPVRGEPVSVTLLKERGTR